MADATMQRDPLAGLNERQREAVSTVDGPVLVIAGAGSGKTRVLTERIAHLLRDHGAAPWEILAFTFTNKAAREMKGRLERSCPGALDALWVGTFHATGVRILRRHGGASGVGRDFSIYDADDSLGVVKQILSDHVMDAHVARSPRALRDRISRYKNDLVTPEQVLESARNRIDEKIALLYREYERALRRNNALDFDDLIARVVELFATSDEARAAYARRFHYVLVDEFQDTNPIQMAMIDGLSSHHRNLFVVGDDDQSIYSWRGARVRHILDFEDLYPGTRVIRLEQNYRSTQTILDAANQVIAHNVGRKGKNLWTDGERGERIGLIASMDEEGEAVNVLQIVRELVDGGVKLRDIAVLYRTNAQSRALEDVLKMGSLPYQIVGGVRFYERTEVRDVLAYCKVLVNPADSVNLRRIINVPRRGIGKTTAERLEALAAEKGTSVMDLVRAGAPEITGAAATRLAEFAALYAELERFAAQHVAPQVVERIVEATSYMRHLKEHTADHESRVENVEEFISAAHAFAESAEDKSLRAFLEEVALVADIDAVDLESGQLTLMTLHNAKGLEFDAVIVTGLEEGLLPHYNSIDDAEAVEEERRLFYVGMTRARAHLYLSWANMRRRMGQIEGGIPSRFLHEVPDACLAQPLGSMVRATSGGSGTLDFGSDEPAAQVHPDYESMSQEVGAAKAAPRAAGAGGTAPSYRVGMRIRHRSYGGGVVRRVEGSGEHTRVTVIFDSGSERKFLAQFAPMRPAR
jgi:DNA helicase-2/ATP-dependent DNA helicase PcrA